METYYINYNTGAGNDYADTLEEAMQIADANACYTQQNITIEDIDGNAVAIRRWWGVEYDPETDYCEDPIDYGSWGYYGDWEQL